MVAERAGKWTFTSDEIAVWNVLRAGDNASGVATGAGTGTFTRRRMNAVDAAELGQVEQFLQVDHTVCRRLAKSGLVAIDAGGYAHITVEGGKAIAEALAED